MHYVDFYHNICTLTTLSGLLPHYLDSYCTIVTFTTLYGLLRHYLFFYCTRIWNVPNEKDWCVVATAEAITLSTPFILLIVLHFHYVFMLICWSLYRCYLPPFRCSASHSFSLSVSLPLFSLSHIKMHGNLFHLSLIAIKSSDKHRCFTQRAE
jgi:hypothetical protein